VAYKTRTATVASAARSSTGNSSAIQLVELGNTLTVFVDVTAQSGTTPTMDLSIEWSHDGTTFFAAQPADTFSQIAATTPKVCKAFNVKAPYYRLVWALGGTSPNYTFAAHEHVTA
jgi:hypothetical protein